ncbi:MAG TPA: ATP-dependent DNA helicase RecQ [Terriglobales bacterium]
MTSGTDLLTPLRQYWGYDSFRPLQERIVRSLLERHDTCVVMPTGGGKSLCYQLPALALGQTAVVVSPLISLMQDQSAQLAQMGIPAALLNSTLSSDEQSSVMAKARRGEFRLLYLSPERLAQSSTINWLKNVPLSFFAIDEAHCISEWGHEFRPDYRQLSALRTHFPDCPIAAFTASATQRVRHDILHQLQMRHPHKYIASFHRANLQYMVKQCETGTQMEMLLRALRRHAQSNVIVYSPTIARVEEVVATLGQQGIAALGYHGKMEAAERRANQERWMSDEVRVLVGTIAFGLGINKATVRAVIHLSLPRSIEQYYQESGRAGRDGEKAECVLLWQKRDAGLLAHFNQQINDAAERDRAWQRYYNIRDFAESSVCRHLQICEHFGEKPKWKSCGVCDVCVPPPEWFSAPAARARKKSGGVSGYSVPAKIEAVANAADLDPELHEYLREWRRRVAKERGVAAFVVLHDTSLQEICRRKPATLYDIRQIHGFGERKTETYGQSVLDALTQFHSGARVGAPQ